MNKLHLSPLLPVEPDWKALAIEMHAAFVDFVGKKAASESGLIDGKEFWQAVNRVSKISLTIMNWRDDPDLYGRLLAKEQILEENKTPES